MKQYAFLLLSAVLALSACSDPEPDSAPPATATSSEHPFSGVWASDELMLVMESNGDFYLPSDDLRQGLSWEQQDDQFTFRYLDSNALRVEQRQVSGQLDGDTLTLTPLSSEPAASDDETGDDESETSENNDAAAFQLSGQFKKHPAAVGFLSGQVQLPESAQLPEQAVLTVTLLSDDQIVLRRVIRLNEDSSHFPFRLYYPADAVKDDAQYQISSQILAGGGLYFQSASTELSRHGKGFDSITLPMDPLMNDSETLRGALVWRAGEAVFTLCNSDQRLQVSGPQGESLIADIRKDMAYPEQPRIAVISGLRKKIPGQQEGTTQAAISVESFTLEVRGDMQNCQLPSAELTNTRWMLSHLGEQAVDVPENGNAPFITLNNGQARGNGGCNSFQGGYQQGDASIRFASLTSTEMACPTLELEQLFHQALNQTDHYRIDGELLTLFDDKDQPVASFQAVYL